ncbi:hypothetical protein GCM10025868_01180 [Angustibacter aerolatus]|uniref:Uncharacterized protein n=1 Tax=Angustibacter aerolatus TaxID=1162965 RepID=A0ABQ6J9L0_9ACTN|nr:hypothetical protein GCM10025868_01180 [Angustibacter aerolatus]
MVGEVLQAVNRRGRTVRLRVTVTALQTDSEQAAGALLLMEDVSDDAPGGPAAPPAAGAEV